MTNISLQPVNADNYWDVISLTVADDQKEFVLDNAVSIGQAYVQQELVPLAIVQDGTPVGFIMYCLDRDDHEYWIYRLMVDQRFQGQGIGREAMAQALARIRQDEAHRCVYLDVHLESQRAVKLYERCGFRFTGQGAGRSHIMRLDW